MNDAKSESTVDQEADGNEPELFVVQHAVIVKSGDNIHQVNDLLTAGWRVVYAVNLTEGSLLVLETTGTEESIEGLRKTLGYADK